MQEVTIHEIDEMRAKAASLIEGRKDFGKHLPVDERLNLLDELVAKEGIHDWQHSLLLKAALLRLTSSKAEILSVARQLRHDVYHFCDDSGNENFIQDVTTDGVTYNRRSCVLVAALHAFEFTPDEEAEMLLSAWQGIHVGFNNPEPFRTIVERVADILPSVTDLHIATYLKIEQTDLFEVEDYLPEIETAIAQWQAATPTYEEQQFIDFFESTKERMPSWETEENII